MIEDSDNLSLRNALLAWCFEERVEDVQAAEIYFTSQELAVLGWPNLGGASNRGEPELMEPGSREAWTAALERAWAGLLLDFRRRVERGQVHLYGVRTKPDRQLEAAAIPGQWAADFAFDVLAGTIEFGEYRYVSVRASATPPDRAGASPDAEAPTGTARPVEHELRVEQIAGLSDEVVQALLEEHARRVVEGPDAKLIAPGKISLMPILRRRMLHRAERGETRESLAAEAAELREWIAARVPSHQVPSANAIENALRNDYRPIKPRSNVMEP